MQLLVDKDIQLELVNDSHMHALYELANTNRKHIAQWMPWIENMQAVEFISNFVKGSQIRNAEGLEYAFVIKEHDILIGRIGIYKIDPSNKIGEIGYWIGENFQQRGITTLSCKALIDFCFNTLKLNRIEIKCAVENTKSQAIPVRLNFKNEGILRQAEFHLHQFQDLILFSMLKEEWG